MSSLAKSKTIIAIVISAISVILGIGGSLPSASALEISDRVSTTNFTVSWDPATLVVPENWFSGTVSIPINWQTTQACAAPAKRKASSTNKEFAYKSVVTVERTMTLTVFDSDGTVLVSHTWSGTPYCNGMTELSFSSIRLYGNPANTNYEFRLDYHWAYNMLDGYGVRHNRSSASVASNLILPPVPQLGGTWVIKQSAGKKKDVAVGWAYLNLITGEDATYACQISKKNSQIVFLPATYSTSAMCSYRLPKKAKFVIRAWAETSIGPSPVHTFNVRT